jgi:mannose/fructose/N-acetylgalactosamine-specific phosphotransferase system component IIB
VSAPGYLLFRVDDRLLHGQVALGWGRRLHPRAYVLADDELAVDPSGRAFVELAAPEGVAVTILSVREAAAAPPRAEAVLLTRSVAAAAALLREGIPGPVDLGGLHAHPGAEPYLPYLFLDVEQVALLRALLAEGHDLFAQDLPESRPRDLAPLLDAGPDPGRG